MKYNVDPAIVIYSPHMRRKSAVVTEFDTDLKELSEFMFAMMYQYNGIGLSACQVNNFIRMFVVDCGDGTNVTMVNPEITWTTGDKTDWETCLSLPGPGTRARVARASGVRVKFQNEEGKAREVEAKGLFARVIQHEYDHLEGVFFIDRVSSLQKSIVLTKHANYMKRMGDPTLVPTP